LSIAHVGRNPVVDVNKLLPKICTSYDASLITLCFTIYHDKRCLSTDRKVAVRKVARRCHDAGFSHMAANSY